MIRRPPRSTRTDTLFPYTTLFRSLDVGHRRQRVVGHLDQFGGIARQFRRLGHHQCHGSRCSRSEEHTSELQSLMRISYAVFCLKKKKKYNKTHSTNYITHQTSLISHPKHHLSDHIKVATTHS